MSSAETRNRERLVEIAEIVRSAPPLPASSPGEPSRAGSSDERRGTSTSRAGAERAPPVPEVPPVARLRSEIEWPYGFDMTAEGLVFRAKDDAPRELLSGPFDVHALVRTEEGGGWSVVISFCDPDGRLQTVVVAKRDLVAGDASDVHREMADKGLHLATGRGARERFTAALAGLYVKERAVLVSRSGWHAGGEVYAAPSFTATTPERNAEPIVFRSDQQASSFRRVGDLTAWVERVAPLAAGQSRLLFSLGVAFSGPLLEPLGHEPGAFNLVGPSSCGKTTALRMAGSVWGGGGSLGFAGTWRTTTNALEGTAAAHNDSLLALDELGMCDPRELAAAAYALTGGLAKGRLKADGELRNRQRWRVMILSTGEITLAQRIAEGGASRVRAGQEVRFVDVPADAGGGHGLFDHLAGFAHGSELSNAVREQTGRFYGTAGPAFVMAFLARREQSLSMARALIADFIAAYVPNGADGQVQRVGARFALVAAAGELAVAFGILPVAQGAVREAARGIFRQWVDERGGAGSGEARDAIRSVRGYLHRHGPSRFIKAVDGYGEGSWRAQNVAGFRMSREDGEDGDFLFHDEGWAEATEGLDRHAAADALAAAGFLKRDAQNKRKRSERIGVRTIRVYRVSASILDGEDT